MHSSSATAEPLVKVTDYKTAGYTEPTALLQSVRAILTSATYYVMYRRQLALTSILITYIHTKCT